MRERTSPLSLADYRAERDKEEKKVRAAQAVLSRKHLAEIMTPEGLLIPPADPSRRSRSRTAKKTQS